MAEYAFIIPGGLEIHFDLPEISLDIDCCVHTKLASLTLEADTISNAVVSRPFIGFLEIGVDDADLLYQSVSSIGTNFAPVYRVHGNPESNMLSRLASQIEYKYDMTPNAGKAMMCREGWVTYNDLECYKLVTDVATYAEAQAACAALDAEDYPGSSLVHIVDRQENDWLFQWITLENTDNVGASVWIGLDDKLEDTVWRWPDTSSGGYTNWDPSQVGADAVIAGDCASLSGSDARWMASDCSSTKGFVCECESVEYERPGTMAPTISPAPSPAPTTRDGSCPELSLSDASTGQIADNVVDFTNFFYPTKCQGTWDLVQTNDNDAQFEISWPGMAIPVQVVMPLCVISLYYEGKIIGTVMPGDTPDLTFQDVGTTSFLKIKLVGDDSLTQEDCLVSKYVSDPSKCNLAKLVDTLLKGAMETGGPLDIGIVITYDNAVTGGSQKIALDISLFRVSEASRPVPGQDSTIVAATLAPSPANSYCELEYDALGLSVLDRVDYMGKCCNSCVNDFVAIYNDIKINTGGTVFSSLDIFWNGVTVYLQVEICNVFSFELRAMRLMTDASFQDLDGVSSWFLPWSGPADEDKTLAEGVKWQSNDRATDLVVPPGECVWTPEIEINAPVTSEVVSRLADEAMYKGRLCISIKNMIIDIGLMGPGGSDEMFSWTQPLDLKKISVLGDNDCVNTPDCTNIRGAVVDQNFDESLWQVNGSPEFVDANLVKLNDGEGSEETSMFLKQRYYFWDDWEVEFTVQVPRLDGWCGSACPVGASFGVVLQSEGLTKTGEGSYAFNGYGSESLGMMFNMGSLSNDAKLLKSGGDDDTVNLLSKTSDVSFINTANKKTSVRVSYSAAARVLTMWANEGETLNEGIASKMIVQVELHDIFTTDGYGYVGFGMDIGTGSYSQVRLLDFMWKEALTSLAESDLEQDGLVLDPSGVLGIDARTSCGVYRYSGGDRFSIVLEEEGGTRVEIGMEAIVDMSNGQYRITFSGLMAGGKYKVLATLLSPGIGDAETELGVFRVATGRRNK